MSQAPSEPGHYWLLLPRCNPEIVQVTDANCSFRRKRGQRIYGSYWNCWLSEAQPDWQWSERLACPFTETTNEPLWSYDELVALKNKAESDASVDRQIRAEAVERAASYESELRRLRVRVQELERMVPP